MKQRKKSFGMRISAFVLSFAMVCTLLAGVNVVAFAADSDDELTDSVSVLRAYNPNNGEHLMTIDEAEYNANVARGYDGEGEAWVAPIYSETEVWRAYNPNSGEHMLAPEAEVKALEAAGWQNEGLKMYSDDAMGTPIYRVFNPNATDAGSHHYCGEEEAAALVELGWQWDNNGEPVIYGVAEEPPVVVVSITDVDQLTANSIWVEFDQDASLLVDQNDIAVSKADGTLTLPINKMEFDLDGMGATLTFAVPLEDDVDYVATLNDSEAGFTASVGEVATVVITTASAQKGVETPIEFVLYDEMGVDITSTVDVDDTCEVDVVYDDAVADTSVPSKSTITMNTVGEEAIVTVTYNSGDSDAVDVIGTGTITCIPAEAVVGYPIYTTLKPEDYGTFLNPNNNMAKFYMGKIQSEPVTVVVGEESDAVYFSAANIADFTVYSYDEYEIESSNDDIMTVQDPWLEDGKQVAFSVSGNQVGTANIVIKATVNDVTTPYTIPVRVVEAGELDSFTYTVDRTTMTNAIDADYYATSTIKAYDTNGQEMDIDPTYEVTKGNIGDEDANGTAGLLVDDSLVYGFDLNGDLMGETAMDAGFAVYEGLNGEAYYTASASDGGKKTIKATVDDGEISKSKTINITVNKLSDSVWNVNLLGANSSEQSVTYQVELTRTTVNSDIDGFKDEVQDILTHQAVPALAAGSSVARLGAYVSGKFAGYVHVIDEDGDDEVDGYAIGTVDAETLAKGSMSAGAVTNSAIKINAKTGIDAGSLAFAIKYNNKYNATSTGAMWVDLDEDGEVDAPGELVPVDRGTIAGATRTDLFAMTLDQVRLLSTLEDGEDAMPIIAVAPGKDAEGEYSLTYYVDKEKDLTTITPSGAYTVTYAWTTVEGDDKTATAKLTVGDVLGTVASAEKVDVLSKNVDSLDADTIMSDNLRAIADMNNNEGDPSALVGLANASYAEWDSNNDGAFVKYAVVKEYMMNGAYVNFYIPISTRFIEK